jgi:hypothetical protein
VASTKERAYDAFEEHGPDAYSAAEWADELDTSKDYVYQLRGDYKAEHEADASEAEEQANTPDESTDDPGPTDGPDEPPESLSEQSEAGEGNDPEPSATTAEASDRTTPEADSEPSATSPADPTPEPESTQEATASTDGGEMVAVGHEGKEKLSPAGFEEQDVSSIDAPDGVDLPDDVSPEDFEPGDDAPSRGREAEPEPEPEPEPEESDGEGGLLSRIRGDSSASESTSEVVEEAPTDAEADRREEVVSALEGATDGPTVPEDAEPGGDGESRNTSTMSNGLVMDEDLVASLFGMPFAQAADATGWDGWELTDEEREANARLIVAYCDEQNIDLSAGGMLAMSLMSTVGGRVAGYAQHRKGQSDDEADAADPSASVDHDPDEEPTETAPVEESEPTEEPRSEPTRDEPTETTEADGEAFDFADSSTW